MVESTAVSCIQSSHPDKNNILWSELFPKKRREKIQGEILQSIFEYRIQWIPHGVFKNYSNTTRTTRFLRIQCILQCFYTQSSHPVQRNYSAYRINSSTRNTTTTRLIPCHPVQITTRHLPATVPRASKQFYTAESSYKAPTAFQGHTAQAGFQ